ncbi:TPA: hypothetical protein ACIJX2_000161 [Serratia marcescens]
MDNKLSELSELSKPVAWKIHHHDRYYFEENADVVAIAESVGKAKGDAVYSQEYVSALLAELEAKDKRIAELEAKTAMTMGVGSGNGNLFVHGDYDSIKAAQAIVLENESLRAKLDTPVRLTDERTLWAGEDDYDTGHVKGWNANRLEQVALLKKQGFTVEGDE